MNSSRPLSTKSLALQERFVVEVAGKVAHLRVFEDIVEVVLRHKAHVVPLAGESLVVLSHQLGVFLVGVDCVAEVEKVVVVGERGEVNPQTANAFLTAVFAVCAAVDAGIAFATAVVFTDCVDECFRRKAELFEACFHLFRDCQVAEIKCKANAVPCLHGHCWPQP